MRPAQLVAAVAAASLLTACTGGGPAPDGSTPGRADASATGGPSASTPTLELPDGHANPPPEPFPESRRAPRAWRTVRCPDLRPHGSGLTVVASVPRAVTGIQQQDGGCSMSTHRLARGFSVQLAPQRSLAAQARRTVVPYLGLDGDDAITSASYDGAATVFGAAGGELLEVHPYSDGLPTDTRFWQHRGVRAGASVPEGTRRRFGGAALRFVGSVSVEPGLEASCPGRDVEVRFRPPVRLTGFVQTAVALPEGRSASTCWISLKGDNTSAKRHAEVRLDPPGSLARRAARLEARHTVHDVHWRPGTATLAGRPAGVLTWVVSHGDRDFEPAGTWRFVALRSARVEVTWGATPDQWRRERPAFERFVRSVRLVPTG
ncbi:MAG: hypothetical protein U0R80_07165 [Nocardioidaceae bacterium]